MNICPETIYFSHSITGKCQYPHNTENIISEQSSNIDWDSLYSFHTNTSGKGINQFLPTSLMINPVAKLGIFTNCTDTILRSNIYQLLTRKRLKHSFMWSAYTNTCEEEQNWPFSTTSITKTHYAPTLPLLYGRCIQNEADLMFCHVLLEGKNIVLYPTRKQEHRWKEEQILQVICTYSRQSVQIINSDVNNLVIFFF